jgi:5-methylcytosine-specific restriction protein A
MAAGSSLRQVARLRSDTEGTSPFRYGIKYPSTQRDEGVSMPVSLNRYCSHAGCHSFAVPGSSCCAMHRHTQGRAYDAVRANEPEHLFYLQPQWRALRAQHLSEYPLCARCEQQGLVTVAVVVHHLVEIRDRPDLALDPDNLQSLCVSCHDAVHPEKGGNRNE